MSFFSSYDLSRLEKICHFSMIPYQFDECLSNKHFKNEAVKYSCSSPNYIYDPSTHGYSYNGT